LENDPFRGPIFSHVLLTLIGSLMAPFLFLPLPTCILWSAYYCILKMEAANFSEKFITARL
jgi:hypothetical protein